MALYHTEQGSVSYTVEGNPTITDGVVSGFSAKDYLRIGQKLDFTKNNEAVLKFTTPSSWNKGSLQYIFASNLFFYCAASGVLRYGWKGTDSTWPDYGISGVLNNSSTYYVKFSNNGNTLTIALSTDGIDYSTTQTRDISNLDNSYRSTITFSDAGNYWEGSIDLNETYIKVNGQAWFGVAPVEVKKVVRQGDYPAEVSGVDSLSLPTAKANSLTEVKLYGDTELLPETYLDTVTLSGGCRQSNLPEGYTQVEYLEVNTTGNTGVYFLTGINATVNTDMGITASNITSASAQLLVAQCVSGSDYVRIAKASATQRLIANFGSSSIIDNNTDCAAKFTARINKSGLYVNGNLVGTFSNVPSSFTGVGAVDIFRGKYSDTAYYAYPGSRLYSAWVDDNIFLPCRRNSDNQLGVYNTKTGQFILPSGNGTFTAGADVVPSPDTPMDIVCNNGVLKFGENIVDNTIDGTGTFISPSSGTTRIYKAFGKLPSGNYKLTITGNFEFIVQYKDAMTNPTTSGNIGSWSTSGEYTLDNPDYYYGIAIRYPNNAPISPSNFNGTISLRPLYIHTDGTQEVVTDSLGNTANAERLLAVSTYKDTQEVINGSVTRRVGIAILDGTETWNKSSTYTGSFYVNNLNPSHGAKIADNPNVYCTHGFKVNSLSEYSSASIGAIYWYSSTTINYKYDDGTATVAQFKQWLADQYNAGTPVIIAYPLATATTESVTGQFLSKSPVTQTAGSISGLPIAITESEKTVPTPTQPLPINCNNGVLGIDGQGNITVTGTTETVEIDTTGDTATAQPLYKVGTYQDIQSVIDGSVSRNVGVKVLDGTENWTEISGSSAPFALVVDDFASMNMGTSILVYSTHFQGVPASATWSNYNSIISFTGSQGSEAKTFRVRYLANTKTLAEFKQFLAEQYTNGTPVICVYCKTPTTETVTAQTLNVQAGNNTLSVTQASMSGLGLSAKYTQAARDVNYVIKDGKLVFADPRIYLAGPVNYTVVGNPTIVDGVASGFVGRSAYLELSDSITYSSSSNLKIHIKFKTGTLTAVRAAIIQCDNMGGNSILYTYGNYLYCMPISGQSDYIYTGTQSNTWYSVDIAVNNDTTECKVYNDNGTLLATKTFSTQFSDVTYRLYFGMQYGYDPEDLLVVDSIDLNETYIQKNNTLLFYGKNYASKNIAPVPSGYTYGTTTTSAIGFVDIPTQQFTAAPSGSVIGKD